MQRASLSSIVGCLASLNARNQSSAGVQLVPRKTDENALRNELEYAFRHCAAAAGRQRLWYPVPTVIIKGKRYWKKKKKKNKTSVTPQPPVSPMDATMRPASDDDTNLELSQAIHALVSYPSLDRCGGGGSVCSPFVFV